MPVPDLGEALLRHRKKEDGEGQREGKMNCPAPDKLNPHLPVPDLGEALLRHRSAVVLECRSPSVSGTGRKRVVRPKPSSNRAADSGNNGRSPPRPGRTGPRRPPATAGRAAGIPGRSTVAPSFWSAGALRCPALEESGWCALSRQVIEQLILEIMDVLLPDRGEPDLVGRRRPPGELLGFPDAHVLIAQAVARGGRT